MRRTMSFPAVCTALLLCFSACGDDSDAADDQPNAAEDVTPGSSDSVADSGGADDGAAGDDILADYLEGSGLTTDIVSDEEHECMNAELRPRYPDGLPENLSEEDIDAVDAAAEACNVTL